MRRTQAGAGIGPMTNRTDAPIAAPATSRAAWRDWLDGNKVPLYVSFFFAALAWTFVRTIDRLVAMPVVEYRMDNHAAPVQLKSGERMIGVRLRNLTHSRPINCLVIMAKAEPTEQLVLVRALATYTLRGPLWADGKSEFIDSSNVQLTVTDFPPGSDIEFGIVASGNGRLRVQVMSCGKDVSTNPAKDAQAQLPVILERSIETRLIEHELPILWSGLGLWALTLFGLAGARFHTR